MRTLLLLLATPGLFGQTVQPFRAQEVKPVQAQQVQPYTPPRAEPAPQPAARPNLGSGGAPSAPAARPGIAAQGTGLAVLPLRGRTEGFAGSPDEIVYERVAGAFFKTKRFVLVERAQLDAVIGEAKLQASGLMDEGTAVTLGKLLGVRYVLFGSYSGSLTRTEDSISMGEGKAPMTFVWYPANLEVHLRMVDVETGAVQEMIDARGTAKLARPDVSQAALFGDLTKKLLREVGNRFPLRGYVIKVHSDTEALVDLGKGDGLAEGDLFTAIEQGEAIRHPVTGKLLQGEKKILGELKVIAVGGEMSTARVSGARFALKPGMILESKPKKRGFWESLGDATN